MGKTPQEAAKKLILNRFFQKNCNISKLSLA